MTVMLCRLTWCFAFDSFLNELRNVAVNSKQISSATLARMKKTPILLGTQRKLTKNEKAPVSRDLDEEEWDLQYDLKRPDQIVIADDTNAHQLFGDSLFTAPQEDILEGELLPVFGTLVTDIVA